ncbi:MAG: hypothetical protein KGL75_05310 [Acidobacteriota bacterium]|nr:hypothetical protein [Acidobacteriota bacterium]
MKRAIGMFGLLAMLALAFGLSTHAAAKATTLTGWISDSHCGAKGMSADHKACAQTCVKTKGEKYVFVSAKTKHVISIANQDAVNPDEALGHEVKVTGSLAKGVLTVDKIEPAS